MDSRIVNREIRARIWPRLKAVGFSNFSPRTAWRYRDDCIDVFNFQSFSAYNAGIIGVTPFSFCVNLGTYLDYVPPPHPPKMKDGKRLPAESQCNFRGRLRPKIEQTLTRDAIVNRVWSIDREGLNLAWCIGDVEDQVPIAMSWYGKFASRREVLRILLQDEERMSEVWGFGREGSPSRAYQAGYVALAAGESELAREKLGKAVASGCFCHLFNDVRGAVNRSAYSIEDR